MELYPDFFFFGRPAQRLSLALTGNGGTKRMGSADSVYGQFQRLHASFYIYLFLLGFHNFSPTTTLVTMYLVNVSMAYRIST